MHKHDNEHKKSTYVLSRKIFLRAIGFVYLIAFSSYFWQYPGLYSQQNGLIPIQNIPNTLNFQPTTLAIFHNHLAFDIDTFHELLSLLGVLWITYFSLYSTGRTFMSFQWDILLLEVGAASILWAPWIKIYNGKSPSHVVRWLLRLIFFKLMLLSGVVKLQSRCKTWKSLTALDYHYATQCIPTPFAWFAHQLPPFYQQLSVGICLLIEIPLSILIIYLNLIFSYEILYLTISLQVLIIMTGNYTFFNLLTICLCIPLVDDFCLSYMFL
eukprot:GSMAST32.ASY1.ANO1.2295.1 assembled CDS